MYQQEIKFFWPLTEQMELPLDYTRCKKQSYVITNANTGSTIRVCNDGMQWDKHIIDLDEVNFTLNKKPFIIKRLMYKLLGLKWKVK